MATVSVVFDGTRLDDAEALSPGGGNVWLDSGGKIANIEPDFVYQNTNCVSEKVGTSELGIGLDISGGTPASVDMTTPKVVIFKVIATNSSVLNVKGSTGGKLEVGSGGLRTNYDQYYAVGGDTYPIKGGWLIIPIDPNGGNQSNRPGTAPTLTAIDYFGWVCDFTGASKSTNVGMDAVDVITNGTGLTLTAGDAGSTEGKFSDFVTADEGTSTNRWGIVSTLDTVLYVTGVLTIGTATATEFTDSNAVVVFPEAEFLNTVGFFGIDFGLQNASNILILTNCVFKSVGTSGGTVDTRPDFEVTGTSGTLTLTTCTFNVFRLWTMTSAVTVTGCNFIAGDQIITGGATLSGCTFDSLTNASQVTVTSPANAALISNSEFISPGTGNGLVISGTAADFTLTNVDFTGYSLTVDANKAIYVNIASGTVNLTISGGSGVSADSHVRTAGATVNVIVGAVTVQVTTNNSAGAAVASAAVHLRASDGTGPFPYQETVTISRTTTTATVTHTGHGMASNDKVLLAGISDKVEDNGVQQITVTTANEYQFTTTDSGSASYIGTSFLIDAQDETNYTASFSGGTDHTVSDVISITGGAEVIVDAVSGGVITQFTVDAGDDGGGHSATDVLSQKESTGTGTGFSLTLAAGNISTRIKSTFVALSGNTNGSGVISTTRVYSTDQPVEGWTRKSSASPYYKEGTIVTTIDSADGLNFTAVMVRDE